MCCDDNNLYNDVEQDLLERVSRLEDDMQTNIHYIVIDVKNLENEIELLKEENQKLKELISTMINYLPINERHGSRFAPVTVSTMREHIGVKPYGIKSGKIVIKED